MSIKIQNLTKIYGSQKAVNNISFEIGDGQIVGFLGPNGAGKSTTMKIITGYLPANSGIVEVCGHNVFENPVTSKSLIGYLPENNPNYLDMYVREYLNYIAGLYKLGKATKERIDYVLETTGLIPEMTKKIGALSKGYRQRVGLAQALIHDPKVLILDEPTTGLDPNQIIDIREVIKKVGQSKTVMLSTHIMQEVEAVCNRTIIINKGQIVADGKTSDLLINSGKTSVSVEFDIDIDNEKLQLLSQSFNIEQKNSRQFLFFSNQGKDIRRDIYNFSVANNTPIISLTTEQSNLEDVFRGLTK
ncbi:MAG: gliding motility-associated ABC transporter ATP-binding subunit GldA [Bacteroidales bacterium]|nr:gliding motility-associated ABC transporter ATP-binding subunit GldA [Bacteroidales bacterium]